MAPCLADTNDLALDPATTAEDTQRTPQSIRSRTGSVFFPRSVSFTARFSLFYLSCPSFPFTPVMSASHLPSRTREISPCAFYPKHFPCYLRVSSLPIPSQWCTLSIPIFSGLFFFSFLHPSSPPPLDLPASLSPIQQLYCPWVRGGTMSSHMGPPCGPNREGREHQRTPITHCFNWAEG